MKIGFSLGRCVRDIVLGKVDLNDVLVIITRTAIRDPDTLETVIRDYTWEPGYLKGVDIEHAVSVANTLWYSGRLHQPRTLVAGYVSTPVENQHVWMDVAPTTHSDNPMVAQAWENYRMVLRMAEDHIPQVPERI